jgi:hypothetical protein
MGAGFVPPVVDLNIIDEVVPIHSDEAMAMTSKLWLEEGLPVGVSSGAIVAAAVKVMSREAMKGKTAVVIIPSFGERYFTVYPSLCMREREIAIRDIVRKSIFHVIVVLTHIPPFQPSTLPLTFFLHLIELNKNNL